MAIVNKTIDSIDSNKKITSYYERMFLIREFENRLLRLFSLGKLFGTTHTCIGQEANAVGVISQLHEDDIVVSHHRCHGHYLAKKDNPYGLLCELLGKEDGLCAGRGGSQHLCDGNFFTNGVQGGIVPLSLGLAFGEKYKKTNRIVTVFLGDGTLGEGIVYEGFNISSKWSLPLFMVLENNRYAQSTKSEMTLAGDIAKRFEAFNIETKELSTFDVREIADEAQECIKVVRKEKRPVCLILNTYRYSSHSKSDDGRKKEEIEEWKKYDCLSLLEKEIEGNESETIKHSIIEYLNDVERKALNAPLASDIGERR